MVEVPILALNGSLFAASIISDYHFKWLVRYCIKIGHDIGLYSLAEILREESGLDSHPSTAIYQVRISRRHHDVGLISSSKEPFALASFE